jgi:HK97 family phage major capsid protein
MSYETKADALEAVFDNPAPQDERVTRLADQVERLSERVGRLTAARPPLSGAKSDAEPQRKAFVDGYLRKGLDTGVELKALAASSNSDGGFAVPKEIDASIQRIIRDISPIRGIATVVNVGSSQYRRLISLNNVASGWVADSAARPVLANDTPKFAELVPPMGELYAQPTASQSMLDDAAFDVEAWLADEIAREFARAEGVAFVSGNGTNRPQGFLSVPTSTVADSAGTRPFGTIQYVPTGVANGFPATNPADIVIDLVTALRPAYRQGAVFLMNSRTLAAVRKFKDTTGQFIWQPAMQGERPGMLFGYPVVEAEDMPDITSGGMAIAFGNFREGYLIAERSETTILRDPFSNKPYVNFYATKRVSGCVSNSEAIKLLRFAVS